jgi:hypothetical protein
MAEWPCFEAFGRRLEGFFGVPFGLVVKVAGV